VVKTLIEKKPKCKVPLPDLGIYPQVGNQCVNVNHTDQADA